MEKSQKVKVFSVGAKSLLSYKDQEMPWRRRFRETLAIWSVFRTTSTPLKTLSSALNFENIFFSFIYNSNIFIWFWQNFGHCLTLYMYSNRKLNLTKYLPILPYLTLWTFFFSGPVHLTIYKRMLYFWRNCCNYYID